MKATEEVAVGSKVSAAFTKIAPKSATPTVTYTSSDSAVATVNSSGEVTGVKAGEATITATMKCGKETKTASTKVSVKKVVLRSVKQTKWDTIEAVIEGDTKSLKNEDILITCKDTNVVCRVKSITVASNDSTKVTAAIYGSMLDGKLYTVKVNGVEKEFTASDNVVADVSVSPLQIAAGDVGTEVVGQVVDKNGVVIREVKLMEPAANVTFDIKVNATDGYTRENKLVLYNAGNTATAEITYHTYKYENGSEVGVIKKSFNIVAVNAVASISEFGYTVLKDGVNPDYKAAKTQIPVDDLDMYAWFEFLDSNNNNVTENYTVETSDRTTLMVADGVAAKANQKVHVVGIKEGHAYINVRDINGTIVKSLPVTVVASRKLARVQLGNSTVVVSNTDLTDSNLTKQAGYTPVTEQNVTVQGFDQYGDPIKITVNATGTTAVPDGLVDSTTSGVLKINGINSKNSSQQLVSGTYSYRLAIADEFNRAQQLYSFNVRVVTPKPLTGDKGAALKDVQVRGSRQNYRLVVTPRTYNATVTSTTDASKKDDIIDVKIGVYESGALIGYLPVMKHQWNNGTTINLTTGGVIRTAQNLFNSVSTTSGGAIYKSVGAGTQRVRVWTNLKLKGATSTPESVEFHDDISITDSANGAAITKWKVSRFATSVPDLNRYSKDADKVIAAKEAIETCLDVSCFGKPVAAGEFYVEPGDVTVTNNAIFIKKAYVIYSVDGGVSYAVPFAINLTFTVQ